MKVQVVKIHRLYDTGNLKAYVTVRVGVLEIRSIKVVQQPNQRAWISLPQEKDSNGNYYPIVKCHDPNLEIRIKRAVMSRWELIENEE